MALINECIRKRSLSTKHSYEREEIDEIESALRSELRKKLGVDPATEIKI
jgi:hypothetical protein